MSAVTPVHYSNICPGSIEENADTQTNEADIIYYPTKVGMSGSLFVLHKENELVKSERNCTDGVPWIWDILDDCVTNWEEKVSISMIITSMILWMCVIFPQLIKNCRDLKSVEGISVFFVSLWLCGDLVNLIGSAFLHLHHKNVQLLRKFQGTLYCGSPICVNILDIFVVSLVNKLYISVYFVVIDTLLLTQIAHHYLKQRQRIREIVQTSPGSSQIVLCLAATIVSFSGLLKYFGISLISQERHIISNSIGGRHLMSTSLHRNLRNNHGYFQFPSERPVYLIGIVACLFYIGSRISQILKNYRRKSTEGLSMLMFCLAVLGNITYIIGMLIRAENEHYVMSHLSWIIGSLAVIFFDAIIIFQFRYYGLRDFDTLSRQPLLDDGTPTVN